ncbi:MAG: hypothetical protein D3926_03515 [Desulfobacteraceae bacterium]|nr:MAG: hypothetical protein D3926_03515 [Desulfobacteraceae bacterium]
MLRIFLNNLFKNHAVMMNGSAGIPKPYYVSRIHGCRPGRQENSGDGGQGNCLFFKTRCLRFKTNRPGSFETSGPEPVKKEDQG